MYQILLQWIGFCRKYDKIILVVIACDVFVRTNLRTIAMMFVRTSVCLSGTDVHCDHTVHYSADLSLWLDSAMPTQYSLSCIGFICLFFCYSFRLLNSSQCS